MPQQIPEEVLYDVRLVERHVAKGLLNPKDLEKRLNALEDQTAQAESTSLDELMQVAQRGQGGRPPANRNVN